MSPHISTLRTLQLSKLARNTLLVLVQMGGKSTIPPRHSPARAPWEELRRKGFITITLRDDGTAVAELRETTT